jgi:hypothetical protein
LVTPILKKIFLSMQVDIGLVLEFAIPLGLGVAFLAILGLYFMCKFGCCRHAEASKGGKDVEVEQPTTREVHGMVSPD